MDPILKMIISDLACISKNMTKLTTSTIKAQEEVYVSRAKSFTEDGTYTTADLQASGTFVRKFTIYSDKKDVTVTLASGDVITIGEGSFSTWEGGELPTQFVGQIGSLYRITWEESA